MKARSESQARALMIRKLLGRCPSCGLTFAEKRRLFSRHVVVAGAVRGHLVGWIGSSVLPHPSGVCDLDGLVASSEWQSVAASYGEGSIPRTGTAGLDYRDYVILRCPVQREDTLFKLTLFYELLRPSEATLVRVLVGDEGRQATALVADDCWIDVSLGADT